MYAVIHSCSPICKMQLNVLNDLAEAMKAFGRKKKPPLRGSSNFCSMKEDNISKNGCAQLSCFSTQMDTSASSFPKSRRAETKSVNKLPRISSPLQRNLFGLDATAENFLDLCQPACLRLSLVACGGSVPSARGSLSAMVCWPISDACSSAVIW